MLRWMMGIKRIEKIRTEGIRARAEDLLEGTEMRMLRWMMGIKRIEKIRTEGIRAKAGVAGKNRDENVEMDDGNKED